MEAQPIDAAQLAMFWKVLLVFLSVSQAVSAAGYVFGRWQQRQEGTAGSQGSELRRIDREVGELRRWRHDVQHEETKDMAALFNGFVTREEFRAFSNERREETTRIWTELNRLRNGKH